MDIYSRMLQERFNEIQNHKEKLNTLDHFLLLKEIMKYLPNHTGLLNQISIQLLRWGLLGEALQILDKSLSLDGNKQAHEIMNTFSNPPMPSTVTLELSTVCNLRCPLCYTGARTLKRMGRYMKYKDFCNIWKEIRDHTKMLIIVGQGETFLNKDVYRILDSIQGASYVYIDTNGNIPLNHQKIISTGVDEIVFSIDGINQETYAIYRQKGKFDIAVDNLRSMAKVKKQMKSQKPKIVFKYVVFKHTEEFIEQARQISVSLGADDFRIEPCTFEPPFGFEALKKFMPTGDQWRRIEAIDFENGTIWPIKERYSSRCSVPFSNIYITVDGDVGPCCGVDQNRIPILGNLLNQSLMDIWHSEIARSFRMKVLRNRHEERSCDHCSYPMNHLGRCFDGILVEANHYIIPDTATRIYDIESN